MVMKALSSFFILIILSFSSSLALALGSEEKSFIDHMVKKHQFDRATLEKQMKQVKLRQDIIDAISRPAEGKPWHEYRKIFLTQARIKNGAAFIKKHEKTLKKAEKKYGVPVEIIAAIIGVETNYGRLKGRYRVMDSLYTLGFHYPKRSKFFRKELEHFLLMARQDGFDPFSLKGSYAGAMGTPQFISSSYREYAVDFDGDGKRDLIDNVDDAIGSVANYLKRHGWVRNGVITQPAVLKTKAAQDMVQRKLKPKNNWSTLKQKGVHVDSPPKDSEKGALLAFELKKGHEHWVGWKNFYVITRYNHSALYAMAVYQLSEELKG